MLNIMRDTYVIYCSATQIERSIYANVYKEYPIHTTN